MRHPQASARMSLPAGSTCLSKDCANLWGSQDARSMRLASPPGKRRRQPGNAGQPAFNGQKLSRAGCASYLCSIRDIIKYFWLWQHLWLDTVSFLLSCDIKKFKEKIIVVRISVRPSPKSFYFIIYTFYLSRRYKKICVRNNSIKMIS